MATAFHKLFAVMAIFTAGAAGCISYGTFLLFLYTGSMGRYRLELGEYGTLFFDGGLCLAFFLQHSGMIRRSFRRKVSGWIPEPYQKAAYTVASGLALLALIVLWQDSDTVIWKADGPVRTGLRMMFFLSMLGMGWGVVALRQIDMFGLDPIMKDIDGASARQSPFIVRGPYRWVRHPLYLFMVVLFWTCPVLSADRLFFNFVWTSWVLMATVLEEKDLADDFGSAYGEYRKNVPMIFPRGLRPFPTR